MYMDIILLLVDYLANLLYIIFEEIERFTKMLSKNFSINLNVY